MDRITQAQAATEHASRMAAARRSRMPEWAVPSPEASNYRRRISQVHARGLRGYETFLAVKAQRSAEQAAIATDSPDPAI